MTMQTYTLHVEFEWGSRLTAAVRLRVITVFPHGYSITYVHLFVQGS